MKEIYGIDISFQNEMIKKQAIEQITKVIDKGEFILGDQVTSFEKEFADYIKSTYAIGVGNGTDALTIALTALGIGYGDEVITSPYTFFATAESIALVGAKPVFIDVKEDTFNINVNKIEENITDKTKAILAVHIFGQCADMYRIMEIARKHDLYVIEDACQAVGATYGDKFAGTIGDIGCFSFFPTKNLSCFGDGGMIVTNRKDLYQACRKLRVHGSEKKYIHSEIGFNSRLDELQAAVLRVKLSYLFNWNEERRQIAAYYNSKLKNVRVPIDLNNGKHVYHLYNVVFESEVQRQRCRDFLADHGIQTMIYYIKPLHLQEVFEHLGYLEGALPIAEKLSKQSLAIPLYPGLSHSDIDYIVDIFNQSFL